MLSVRADFPTDWPHATVYTLADLHIGDAHCDESEVLARVKAVQDDPYGLCVLNGDLMNTALRNSVSDVYGEVLSPMQQITYLVNMLRPIAGKIIGVTAGNHENRVYKSDGIDVTRRWGTAGTVSRRSSSLQPLQAPLSIWKPNTSA